MDIARPPSGRASARIVPEWAVTTERTIDRPRPTPPVLMALVSLDCLLPSLRWERGILTGLATAVKLTPAAFIMFFLLRGDRRTAATSALSAAVAIVAVIGMRRASALGEPSWALSLNAFAALLISPISWSHHWVWAVPGLLVLAVLARRRSWRAGLAAFCAGFVIFMVSPPWLLPHYGNAELQWVPWEQVASDSYAIIAVTVLVLSVRLPLVSRPTARVQVEVQRPRVGLRD
jgi:alpha-1,2-mannosyltransferase